MKFDELKEYLLSKPETAESFPFGDDVHVFRVKNKMYALVGWRNDLMMLNLKCDPDESVALRDIFPAITEGYHMDKKHWVSIYFDNTVPKGEILRIIDNSFLLVVSKMNKKEQASIIVHL